MPSSNPKFLMDMLHKVRRGETVRGKNGNLEIELSDNGRYLQVHHFGTLILHVDFHQYGHEQVIKQYGESQTDARYIGCVLNYYYLGKYFDWGYGKVAGWRFNVIFTDEKGALDKKDYILDYHYYDRYSKEVTTNGKRI